MLEEQVLEDFHDGGLRDLGGPLDVGGCNLEEETISRMVLIFQTLSPANHPKEFDIWKEKGTLTAMQGSHSVLS